MALLFVSSTPSSGTSDYFINKSIELTYNQSIDASTLTDNVIFLIDLSTNQNVPVSMARKANNLATIIISPLVNLKENASYRIVVTGLDQAMGYSLMSLSAETLTTTTVILFTTGDNVYQVDKTLEKEASNLTLEGDLFLPTNVKALGYDFTISKVRPRNHTHGVPLNLTGDNLVRFSFTKQLLTGEDCSDWADVRVYPILQDVEYLGTGGYTGESRIPGHTISVTGSDLLVTFQSELPQDVAVSINLNSTIKSEDNEEYGGAMKYIINSESLVNGFGPEAVKLELASISDQLYDDYIGALLFKNAIFLWEKTGRSISLGSPTFPVKKYILLSTLLDIMEDKDYHKFVLGGTRRQLGDLNVSVDNPVGRLALKIARVQKEKDIAMETLFKGWQFKALASAGRASWMSGDRLWYDINLRYTDPNYKYFQSNYPVSNTSLNRHAKTTNPFW
jgi:Bacterial Ig-like domain